MSTPTLKFKRQAAGQYFAYDDTKQYAVRREGKSWILNVRNTVTTAGVQHALGQPVIGTEPVDKLRRAMAIASRYSAFGDDYKSWEHGYVNRLTRAVIDTYQAEIDAMTEEVQ